MKIPALLITGICLLLACNGCTAAGSAKKVQENGPMIKIGWGKRSIAKEGNVFIAGQMSIRIAQETYTPVLASALAVENNGDAAVFVSLDMVSITPDLAKQVRELAAKEIKDLPAEKIVMSATHTHAGPSDRDLIECPHSFDIISGREMRKFLSRQIVDAVKDAWNGRKNGAIAYGYGLAATGHSRRATYLDDIGKRAGHQPGYAVNGHAKMYGKTDDPMFAGYENGTDPFVNLLYTFDENGKLTGAVINVPCPSQTNEGAWSMHASFWHNVREKLAAKYGDIGVIGQSAAAGDLAPRQLHYLEAEKRRYRLKYADKIAAYKPMKMPLDPGDTPERRKHRESELIELLRAEDIANRIVEAFDEVLSWAEKEKSPTAVVRHEIKTVDLDARMFPADVAAEERETYKKFCEQKFIRDGEPYNALIHNSRLASLSKRSKNVIERFENQANSRTTKAQIHAVRIGDVAFVTSRFELFMDFMHRIQGRSPFIQTFIIQLAGDENSSGSYLATERAIANKGYSASPYCNDASAEGGQQLVEETLKMLEEMKK